MAGAFFIGDQQTEWIQTLELGQRLLLCGITFGFLSVVTGVKHICDCLDNRPAITINKRDDYDQMVVGKD